MKMKYTPKPWKYVIHRYPNGETNGTPYIYAPHGPDMRRHVANVFFDPKATPEIREMQIGNGQLFALAPDMLEALRECITEDNAPGMQPGLGRQRRRLHAINDIARAVLAKLEGGQQ